MILILGSNGQLGREMQRQMTARGLAFAASDFPDVDITDRASVEKLLDAHRPDAVVNCAAYTNVDKAETDEENARRVNALGPKILAELCRDRDLELVHISTDYVFSGDPLMESGRPRPYRESDSCAPRTVYGRTKREGELFVQEICPRHYILRTAWLYGDGGNFVRTMRRLAQANPVLKVVNDQIGSPTSTVDLGQAILALLGSGQYGLYHATCEGQGSWYDFARKIFELTHTPVEVQPVSSGEFVRPAPRPAWSVLDNTALKAIGKNVFRPWEDSLREYLETEDARQ